METNGEGFRLLAGAHTRTSQLLSDTAVGLISAAAEFAPAYAGGDYSQFGTQIRTAMEATGQQVSGWAVRFEESASSVALSATALTPVDSTSAADINTVDGAR
ncbi:hypothetical protein ACWEKR_09060 [Nocardia sp. NPDC004573]